MAGCPDDLPDAREPVTLATALDVIEECHDLLLPSTDLYANRGFVEWEERFIAWAECGPESCGCHLDHLRYALEDVAAVEPRGSLILDAMKLAFSAYILARENPYFAVIEGQRNLDIDPVLRRAIDLLRKGREGGPVEIEFAPEVQRNYFQNRRQEWLGNLIETAAWTAE